MKYRIGCACETLALPYPIRQLCENMLLWWTDTMIYSSIPSRELLTLLDTIQRRTSRPFLLESRYYQTIWPLFRRISKLASLMTQLHWISSRSTAVCASYKLFTVAPGTLPRTDDRAARPHFTQSENSLCLIATIIIVVCCTILSSPLFFACASYMIVQLRWSRASSIYAF